MDVAISTPTPIDEMFGGVAGFMQVRQKSPASPPIGQMVPGKHGTCGFWWGPADQQPQEKGKS